MISLDSPLSFDTTFALSGLFLWSIFGFLSTSINCDLQRFIKRSPIFYHLIGLVAFFFLFTLIDTNNKASVSLTWFKTIYVYVLYVLMTKSKWFFVLPVLGLLLIDQSLKKDVEYRKSTKTDDNKDSIESYANLQTNISSNINKLIIFIIVAGSLHYMYIQKLEYKNNFSLYKFFMGIGNCDFSK